MQQAAVEAFSRASIALPLSLARQLWLSRLRETPFNQHVDHRQLANCSTFMLLFVWHTQTACIVLHLAKVC